ncbi:hypothetical protein ID867_19680 [Streptomyces parvulus]|nr:hypothetical protein [Streptomyces parvulus]
MGHSVNEGHAVRAWSGADAPGAKSSGSASGTGPDTAAATSRAGWPGLWTQHDGLVAAGAAAIDLVGFTVTSQMDQGHVPVAGCLVTVVASLFLPARRRAPLAVLVCVLAANLATGWFSSVGLHYGRPRSSPSTPPSVTPEPWSERRPSSAASRCCTCSTRAGPHRP